MKKKLQAMMFILNTNGSWISHANELLGSDVVSWLIARGIAETNVYGQMRNVK